MSIELFLVLLIGIGIIYFYKKHYKKKEEPIKTTPDFKMGTDYAFGLGFPQMDKLAAEVFTKVAKAGDVDAYAALGNMYSRGVHFKKDYEEAIKWYRLAADAGHATATYELSCCYMEGYGVPIDMKESISLLVKAAQLGEPTAQSLLGTIYELGEYGFNKDATESLSWYMKAAQQGNLLAEMKVGDAYIEGKLIHPDQAKGIEYITKAAEKNYIQAILRLGLYYDQGLQNFLPNPELSFEWYMKGALLGDTACEYSVGFDYLTGKGVEKDDKEAAIWIVKAADKGHANAEYTVGVMLLRGIHFGVDVEEAKVWFNKAASQGLEQASEELRKLEG